MSALTPEDVNKIALLARLHLSDEEKKHYQTVLSSVLDYVAKLEDLELDNVPPTTHAVAQQNVVRPDVVNSTLPVEAALSNSAATADNQFAIQAVLDEE